jgi:hypothetical protein
MSETKSPYALKIGQSLRVFDLKMPPIKRIAWFCTAAWLLVAFSKANSIVGAKLGEQFVSTNAAYLVAFALLELVAVISVFFYLCHLTLSTTGIDFDRDEKKYTVWLHICGLPVSKQTLPIPEGAVVYVQKTKKFFAWPIYTIRVGPKGPLIISRIDHENCLTTAKEIADYLELEQVEC